MSSCGPTYHKMKKSDFTSWDTLHRHLKTICNNYIMQQKNDRNMVRYKILTDTSSYALQHLAIPAEVYQVLAVEAQ